MTIRSYFLNKIYLIKFERDGFLVIENFISVEKCNELRNETENIIKKYDLDAIKKIPVFSKDNESKVYLINMEIFFIN